MNPHYLANDIGLASAAAWHTDAGVESEHVILGRKGDVPAHLIALESWIESLILRAAPCAVFVERHTRSGGGSQTLDAYTNVARLVCAHHDVPCHTKLAALSARKLALGGSCGPSASSSTQPSTSP